MGSPSEYPFSPGLQPHSAYFYGLKTVSSYISSSFIHLYRDRACVATSWPEALRVVYPEQMQ